MTRHHHLTTIGQTCHSPLKKSEKRPLTIGHRSDVITPLRAGGMEAFLRAWQRSIAWRTG